MPIFEAIILGIIQGLTEFIPISSSGHLIVVPILFGWNEHDLWFDVALHLGTLVAVVIYFAKDWITIIRSFIKHLFGRQPYKNNEGGYEGKLLIPIIIACVPAAIVGFLWDDYIEANFRQLPLVATMLILISGVMFGAERYGRKDRSMASMTYKDYIIIGCAQALALVPGTSRSGITISAGLFLNLGREAAARFSFLLSTPIIFGAGMMQMKKLFIDRGLQQGELMPFVIGFLTASIVGLFAIHFLMNYLKNRTMNIFVIYRVLFAILLVIVFLAK